MLCDTHIHSLYSFDGKDSIDTLCSAAATRNIQVIAITDHSEAMENKSFDIDEEKRLINQKSAIETAREKYKDSLTILHGCELGQPHLNPEYSFQVLNSFDFDYIIGSLHYFKGNVDIYEISYTRENASAMLYRYFDEIIEMTEAGGFHSLGHLDYILRRMQPCFDGAPTLRGFESRIMDIFELLVKHGIALEVNSSGMRNWLDDIGMEIWLLKLFRSMGGEHITFGSDAHDAQHVGLGFSRAARLIKSAGFDRVTYFKGKIPYSITL